jgi:flagellar basal-body rod protein FlgB
MFLNNSFGRTLDVLHRSMDVSRLRNDVIANNIANADTPNFKRTVVNFESELKYALDEAARPPRFRAALTDDRHIPFSRVPDYRDVLPRRYTDYWTNVKNNGNNVDIEEESMNLLNTQLSYQNMTRAVSDQFTRVNLVLR